MSLLRAHPLATSSRERLADRVLAAMSYSPARVRQQGTEHPPDEANALHVLCRVYPDFLARIQDKEVLDFG